MGCVMKQPVVRHRSYRRLVLLALLLGGASLASPESQGQPPAAAPGVDLNRVHLNWRVRNMADTGVLLTDARPGKLFYWPGEVITGVVVLFNTGTTAQTVTVKVQLEQELDRLTGAQQKKVEVAPGAAQRLEFTWPAKAAAYYGQALLVEVVADGKPVAQGEDCFGVAGNVWEIGITSAHPGGFGTADVDKARVESALEECRDRYLNSFEKFFWAPDDFGMMTPARDTWYSGQARYHENRDNLKHLCEYGRRIGVMPTSYGKSIGSGSAARDLIRAHPEYVHGFGGVMDFGPDTEELEKWDRDSEKRWQSTAWAMYNMNDPAVVQYGIDQIIGSTKQFGWAGVRFDGHFQARTGKQRVGDQLVDFTADMADRQTAANQRLLKEQMLTIDPRYVFGYNYAEYAFAEKMAAGPREALELCAGGGQVMDEAINGMEASSNPYNKWADFGLLLVREAEQVRRLGGHLAPILNRGPEIFRRYKAAMAFAAGAHPTMCVPFVPQPYNRFATRYSGLLWHRELRNVWNPNGLILAPPGVMWEPYVRELAQDATHKQLIVHVLNPPLQASGVETQAACLELDRRTKLRQQLEKAAADKKIKPDFGELDRLPPLKLFPDPQVNVPVRLVPQALGRDWVLKRAVLLDPETATRQALAVDTADPYFWEVRVPKLTLWAVLVFELERKGK